MKKCLIISKLHRQPAAVSYFWFWFIPDSHHQHQAASAPHRSCRLLPPPGDQQWAGSRLSGCDITFPNIYRWKFVHIWKRAPLSPPVGAIPCRHLSCSLCSLGMCVCDCEYVCVCVCVCDRERERRGSHFTLQGRQTWPELHMFTGGAASWLTSLFSMNASALQTAQCRVQWAAWQWCKKSRSFMLLEWKYCEKYSTTRTSPACKTCQHWEKAVLAYET